MAVFIWVMIYPMMVNVDFASLKDVGKKPKGLCITLVVNWLIKPFTMAGTRCPVFRVPFCRVGRSRYRVKEYIAGMILLGVAPCTAMVFVWSQLVRGDANYTLVQVSINDIIMVVAFAPIAALAAGCDPRHRALGNAAAVGGALCSHSALAPGISRGASWTARDIRNASPSFTARLKPVSVMGLLATVVLLFGFQAQTIVDKPMVIVLIAIPLHYPELRHLRGCLWMGVSVARSVRYGSAGGTDRHVELLRVGGCCCHQPVRPEFWRGASDCCRCACGSPGDAVPGRHCQQDTGSFSRAPCTAVVEIHTS
jgi:ACR3 family arsenite efflux pump ArsB